MLIVLRWIISGSTGSMYARLGANELPKAAKEHVTYDYTQVPSKYKSRIVITSIFGK